MAGVCSEACSPDDSLAGLACELEQLVSEVRAGLLGDLPAQQASAKLEENLLNLSWEEALQQLSTGITAKHLNNYPSLDPGEATGKSGLRCFDG